MPPASEPASRIEGLGRRLRIVLGQEPEPQSAGEPGPSRPAPEIEFIGYAEDCLLMGQIRMDADRLTDLLNAHEDYQLLDVLVQSLAADHAIQVPEVVVARDELLLVQAMGARGDRRRRIRTRSHPLAMQVGPYLLRGYLHALPGVDPIASFRRRTAMVPLTDAWIEFEQGSGRQRRRVDTVLVNRDQVDWIVEAMEDEVEMPDLPLRNEHGPLVKGLTEQVRVGPPGKKGRR